MDHLHHNGWESSEASHKKGVRAIDARNSQLDMAQVLQKPVFALPGCQRMSVNALLLLFLCWLNLEKVQGATRFRGQKNRTRKKTNSWERRFPGTFRTNVPLILPIFSVFSVGGGPKVPRNFVPGNFFFLF